MRVLWSDLIHLEECIDCECSYVGDATTNGNVHSVDDVVAVASIRVEKSYLLSIVGFVELYSQLYRSSQVLRCVCVCAAPWITGITYHGARTFLIWHHICSRSFFLLLLVRLSCICDFYTRFYCIGCTMNSIWCEQYLADCCENTMKTQRNCNGAHAPLISMCTVNTVQMGNSLNIEQPHRATVMGQPYIFSQQLSSISARIHAEQKGKKNHNAMATIDMISMT